MSKYPNLGESYEIAGRIDGLFNVWAWLPWPDEELDSHPGRLALFLMNSRGWRSYGWQVVHVAPTADDARRWLYNHR